VEPLLRLSAVSVFYAGVRVLDHIDLAIQPGEVVGLTGPSGAGKSTLALTILGALPREAKFEGTVSYRGAYMGPVFQEPSGALHPMLSAGRQVMEAARVRCGGNSGARRVLSLAAFKDAGLDADRVFSAWPHQLSGGERQRVLIAQAIVGRPELLIADEPTASLDTATRSGILDTLRALRTSMLFITHTPELLRGFASRILALRNGRLHG
jgi:ABC-type glutathione transport system ATPase component